MTLLLIASVLNLAHATRNPFDWGSKNLKNIPCLPGNSSSPSTCFSLSLSLFLFVFLSPSVYHLGINVLFHMSALSIKRSCGKLFGDGGDCSL